MVYLFDAELPTEKSVYYALTNIYGINLSTAKHICNLAGFCDNLKIKHLSKDQINNLIKIIENLNVKLTSELKKSELKSFQNLVSIKSYRGLRRIYGLPVRGQRTHTNAQTSRKKGQRINANSKKARKKKIKK
jgi:small subunit ribosomal protein S13